MGHRDGRHKALYAAKTVPFTVPKGLLTGLGEALPLFCNESISYLTYKAACAGRRVVAVNPAYTSQTCSQCGHRVRKELSERVHRCSCCGIVLDRDHNAALNILALGRQSLAKA